MKKYYCSKCMGKLGLGESEKTKETRCTFCNEYEKCFITEGTLSVPGGSSARASPARETKSKASTSGNTRKRIIEKLSGPLVMDEDAEDVSIKKPVAKDVLSLTASDIRELRNKMLSHKIDRTLSEILGKASSIPELGEAEVEVGDKDVLVAVTEKLKEKGFDVDVVGQMVRVSW